MSATHALMAQLEECIAICEGALRNGPLALGTDAVANETQQTKNHPTSNAQVFEPRKVIYHPGTDVSSLMRLNELYREEAAIKNKLSAHMHMRALNCGSPRFQDIAPRSSLSRDLQQGPQLSSWELGVLNAGQQELLSSDVDRFTVSASLTASAPTIPNMNMPRHAVKMLGDFFEHYGQPNLLEAFWLCQALRIQKSDLDVFFNHKQQTMKNWGRSQTILNNKEFIQRLHRDGLLDAALKAQLDKEGNTDVVVDDEMD